MSDIANPPDLRMVHRPELDEIARETRALRRRLGMTTGDVARYLRCTVSHVSAAERSYEGFTANELFKLSTPSLRGKAPERKR